MIAQLAWGKDLMTVPKRTEERETRSTLVSAC